MDKRDFLKTSGVILAGTVLSRHALSEAANHTSAENPRTNWAGNYTFKAAHLDEPATAEETRQMVKRFTHSKALGARHSFNNIADTAGDQIFLKRLDHMTLNKRLEPLRSEQVSPTANSHPGLTHKALPSITWRRFRTFPLSAPARQQPTAQAFTTAISPPSSPPSNLSTATAKSSLSPVQETPINLPERS